MRESGRQFSAVKQELKLREVPQQIEEPET
jgi:hypothetical protein